MDSKHLLRKIEVSGLALLSVLSVNAKVLPNINVDKVDVLTETVDAAKKPVTKTKYYKNTKKKQQVTTTTYYASGKKKSVTVSKYDQKGKYTGKVVTKYSEKTKKITSKITNLYYKGKLVNVITQTYDKKSNLTKAVIDIYIFGKDPNVWTDYLLGRENRLINLDGNYFLFMDLNLNYTQVKITSSVKGDIVTTLYQTFKGKQEIKKLNSKFVINKKTGTVNVYNNPVMGNNKYDLDMKIDIDQYNLAFLPWEMHGDFLAIDKAGMEYDGDIAP